MSHSDFSSTPLHHVVSVAFEISLYILLFLASFLFIPFFTNPFDLPKLTIVFVASLATLVLWSIITITQRQLRWYKHPLIFTLLGIIVSSVVSTLMNGIYLPNMLTTTYGVLALMSLISIVGVTILQPKNTQFVVEIAMAIGILVVIISILQLLGIGPSVILNQVFKLQLPTNFQFSTTGSPFISATLLATILTPIIFKIIQSILNNRKVGSYAFDVFAGLVIGVGLLLHIVLIASNETYQTKILPFSANWSIATDILKSSKQTLLGVGPTRFADAFTAFKPVWLNSTPHWNSIYQIGSNTPLSLFVTLGAIGAILWILFVFQLLLLARKTPPEHISIAIFTLSATVIQIFFPPNVLLIIVQFIGLTFWLSAVFHANGDYATAYPVHSNTRSLQAISPFAVAFGGVGLAVTLVIVATQIVRAEYAFSSAVRAGQTEGVSQMYELQKETIVIFPFNDGYRRSYAQTNFLIANALSRKENLTEEEKTTIAQLLQQAIREARASAAINPVRSQNWRVMGEIYRNLIGSTKGADQWAVASYVQAIQTSPNDPTLRVDLGGIFYALQNYELSTQLFQQAVTIKPDYTNAYYNLANSLKAQEKYQASANAYQRALGLLDPSSEDYKKAKEELDVMVKEVQDKQAEELKKTGQETKNASDSASLVPSEQDPQEAELPKEITPNPGILDEEPESISLESDTASQSATTTPQSSPSPIVAP